MGKRWDGVMQNVFWNVLITVFLFTGLLCPQTARAADAVETAGDMGLILVPSLAFGATFYFDDAEGRIQFYKSFATNLIVTFGLKKAIDKKRPNGKDESFPSGHTSAAFQSATFLHQRYGLTLGLPAYAVATFVGYSRIESDNHHFEDVLAGAFVGAASSLFFTQPFKDVVITPTASNGIYGLGIAGDW